MLKYILLLLIISSSALANSILVITNGTVTGTNGQQIKIISSQLDQEGYKTDIKITNQNCALAKLLWDSSESKTLMLLADNIDGLSDKDNKSCYIEPKKENLVFWLYTSPYFLCSAGNKTWNDLLLPNNVSTVLIHADNRSVKLFEQLAKKYNNKIKTIKVNSSSIVLTMVKANEVDFVFRSGIFDLEVFKDKCMLSSIPFNDLPDMTNILSELSVPNSFVANGYLISKNFTSIELDSVVKIIKKAADSEEMRKINQRRNYKPHLVDFKNDIEYLKKIEELYNQLKE